MKKSADHGLGNDTALLREFDFAWPQYNGAIESGIGSLKTRVETQAAHRGHPGMWTGDDVEAARREADVTARPRAAPGRAVGRPSPAFCRTNARSFKKPSPTTERGPLPVR